MGRDRARRSGLERLWHGDATRRGAIAALPLCVAAGMFRSAVAIRNLWWRRMARRAGIPVISIGNLTVGGNAKTPFTLFLAARLQGRGFNVAIVSRDRKSTRLNSSHV